MRHHLGIATVVAAAGLSFPALAQDSVSSALGGLPGDALSPWTEGCAAYVIDLAPITTSQGNIFGVAPILKSSKMSTANFNALASAVSISPDVLTNSTFTRPSYSVWDTAGAGVGAQNTPGSSVSPTGAASRFAVALSEFGTTDLGNSYNGMLGAMVSFKPNDPNRLYVDRRVAAVNMGSAAVGSSAALGGVSVDANGNLYFRADGFGTNTGPNVVSGNNIFRVRMADRDCGAVNLISTGGTLNATDWIVNASTVTHSVASHVPASVVGGNGLYAGPNFNAQYVYGTLPGSTTSTGGHLDPLGASNHRGSIAMTQHQALGSGVYTLGISAPNASDETTTAINLWSVDANGAVIDRKAFGVPATITDNDSGFVINYIPGLYESRHHTGSTAFRGGVGTVAVGSDQAGRTLIATTIAENGLNGDLSNQIVVGRFSDANGPVEWTMAAYVDQLNLFTPNSGKQIYDADGNVVGQIVTLSQVASSLLGPGMSAPAIDSVGNVWFLSAVELFDRLPGGGSDNDSALIRAVYNPDTFSYRLELVLELGTIAQGQNSDRPYRIDFLGTAANNNTPAPNSLWSSAVSDKAWNNVSTAGLDTSDPMTNGGLVISTGITYDIDGDGFYNNPTSSFFDPSRPADESYQVLLYIGYYADGPAPCLADFNNDGLVNFFDISNYIAAFNAQDPRADIAAPFGVFNFFDISAFIAAYNAGCP
jgi:hypothetical protein